MSDSYLILFRGIINMVKISWLFFLYLQEVLRPLRASFFVNNFSFWLFPLKSAILNKFIQFWRIFNKKCISTIFRNFLFQFWCSINLSWGHVRSLVKFGPDWFSRFDVYCIQTKKTTTKNRHPDKPNIYLDYIKQYD